MAIETFSHLASLLCGCDYVWMPMHMHLYGCALLCVCLKMMMTSLACNVLHTHVRAHTQTHTPLFGPAQRHTHFKGVWFGSNAVGAGRW